MFSVLIFLLTIGILVVIHEYGHFIVARKCGVKVERFSIGFGKRLYSWYDKQGTEFTISLIPLGGYVKMLDERAGDVLAEDKPYAFTQKSLSKRASIIAAGPIANFLLAIIIFWILAMIGTEARKSVVVSVVPDSIAAQSGVTPNMAIVSINNQEAKSSIKVGQILTQAYQDKLKQIEIELADPSDDSLTITKTLLLADWTYDAKNELPWASLGLVFPDYPATISRIREGSAAHLAGLQSGDTIVKINAEKIENREKLIQFIRYSPQEQISLTVLRDGQEIILNITPTKIIEKQGEKSITRGQIGIEFANNTLNDEYIINYRYNPITSAWIAIQRFGTSIKLIGSFLFQAITGNASMNDLAGPVGIAQAAEAQFSFGITAYLAFLAFLSINLGVMNLLPIPVLDGGHLLFLAIEKIKGSPVSVKVQQNFYLVGAFLLLSLMVITFISDFMRL
ncbi:RIP metalloprotease RseP [Thorsellia kenyensis]|uniref:Zinc metalloprotease n=1 Tax=Thorsellia kenyensis TaxID=1549888 RepID=A0ABV6CD67_9GAMM